MKPISWINGFCVICAWLLMCVGVGIMARLFPNDGFMFMCSSITFILTASAYTMKVLK